VQQQEKGLLKHQRNRPENLDSRLSSPGIIEQMQVEHKQETSTAPTHDGQKYGLRTSSLTFPKHVRFDLSLNQFFPHHSSALAHVTPPSTANVTKSPIASFYVPSSLMSLIPDFSLPSVDSFSSFLESSTCPEQLDTYMPYTEPEARSTDATHDTCANSDLSTDSDDFGFVFPYLSHQSPLDSASSIL